MPLVSVIVCSIDYNRYAAAAGMYTAHFNRAGIAFEMIRIKDAQSMAEGYNRGIDRAKGDLLIFSHDDVEFLAPDFAARLVGHLGRYDLVGVAGASRVVSPLWIDAGPHFLFGQVATPRPEGNFDLTVFGLPAPGHDPTIPHIKVLDGLFLAARAPVARALRFDAETFTHFHLYDLDFSLRAYLAGHSLAVACDLAPLHASPGTYDATWQQQAARFTSKHHPHFDPRPGQLLSLAGIRVPNRESLQLLLALPHSKAPAAS